MFNNQEPLWLPPGSVRALLALGTLVGFLFELIPIEVLMVVMTFYFVDRIVKNHTGNPGE